MREVKIKLHEKYNNKLMKAIFITFDQAHREKVLEALNSSMQRGFTCFEQVTGRGSKTGEPHYGSHAWPGENSAIIAMCDDDKVTGILNRMRQIDEERPMLGLRAFVLPVEQAL